MEIVEDGRTGRLVPPGDASALAERIRELLTDRQQRMDIARRAREMAQDRFSLDTMLTAIEEQIRKASSSEAPRPDS